MNRKYNSNFHLNHLEHMLLKLYHNNHHQDNFLELFVHLLMFEAILHLLHLEYVDNKLLVII